MDRTGGWDGAGGGWEGGGRGIDIHQILKYIEELKIRPNSLKYAK